ncbi:hypothetical protein [Hoylesella timonensis]|uniref:hypothetical protein n=1 Tax=Hoylesella timonensis TaxID=386414 RepID=UPI000E30423E
MKKLSNESLQKISGGKFWGKNTQCEKRENNQCWCRTVYYQFWIKSYSPWQPAAAWYCKDL